MRLRTMVAVGVVVLAGRAAASVPQTFTVQGVLRDSSGALQSATVVVTVKLFDSQTGGTLLATPVAAAPTVAVNGLFSVQVPVNAALHGQLSSTAQVWLELTANADTFPRQQLTSNVYALECATADALAGAPIAAAAPSAGQVLQYDGSQWAPAAAIPSGAVMFFNLAACPAGWSELTAAHGRYVVGLPSGGTLAGVQGAALTDLENRPVGQHGHGVSDPGHVHGITDPGHTHANAAYNGPGAAGYTAIWAAGGSTSTYSVGNASTGIAIKSASTGVTVQNAGAIAGTNAPFIQLLVCQKN